MYTVRVFSMYCRGGGWFKFIAFTVFVDKNYSKKPENLSNRDILFFGLNAKVYEQETLSLHKLCRVQIFSDPNFII